MNSIAGPTTIDLRWLDTVWSSVPGLILEPYTTCLGTHM